MLLHLIQAQYTPKIDLGYMHLTPRICFWYVVFIMHQTDFPQLELDATAIMWRS